MQDPLYQFTLSHPTVFPLHHLYYWLRKYQAAVYFLHSPVVGLTKIGRAENLVSRMRSIQAMNADQLILVGAISRPYAFHSGRPPIMDIERMLHDQYTDVREHGEWFRLRDPRKALLSFPSCDTMDLGCTLSELQTLLSDIKAYDEWRERDMESRRVPGSRKASA